MTGRGYVIRQHRAFVGAVCVLIILLVAGWFARDRFVPVEVGSRAPDYAATDLDGNPVDLSDFSGEVVLLNIWATWCLPCREEMPSMQRLYDAAGPDGLRVVAVSVDRGAGSRGSVGTRGDDVRAFVEEEGLTFPVWRDPRGEIQRAYRTTGVPESFVIDRDGHIVKKVIGPTNWASDANIALIRRLLAE